MATDPESLDEVRDPIAEDEVEVVETGDVNAREEGEERVSHEDESDVDGLEDVEPDSPDETEVAIEEAEGPETDT